MLSRVRAAALAVTAMLAFAACEDGGAVEAVDVAGRWRAEIEAPIQRTEFELELRDGGYTWVQSLYTQAGRAEDGLFARTTLSGEWEVRGDRLALRATSFREWTHAEGERVLDPAPAWDETNRITHLQGDRMTITFHPPPYVSYVRPPLDFRRVR
jgi:hypothetical protein